MPPNTIRTWNSSSGPIMSKDNEIGGVKSIKGNEITLYRPLKNDHPVKDIVTVEFVRQRFWVDSDVGTVFWHDHALGRVTWPHGGFGTIVIEPVGSTYHDPKTGKQVRRATRRHPDRRTGRIWRERQFPRVGRTAQRYRAAYREHCYGRQPTRTAD